MDERLKAGVILVGLAIAGWVIYERSKDEPTRSDTRPASITERSKRVSLYNACHEMAAAECGRVERCIRQKNGHGPDELAEVYGEQTARCVARNVENCCDGKPNCQTESASIGDQFALCINQLETATSCEPRFWPKACDGAIFE